MQKAAHTVHRPIRAAVAGRRPVHRFQNSSFRTFSFAYAGIAVTVPAGGVSLPTAMDDAVGSAVLSLVRSVMSAQNVGLHGALPARPGDVRGADPLRRLRRMLKPLFAPATASRAAERLSLCRMAYYTPFADRGAHGGAAHRGRGRDNSPPQAPQFSKT